MARHPQDWHREDIKAAVRKSGTTLSALALAHGLSVGAMHRVLRVAWPRAQAIIAAHLGLKPEQIWPSRYDASGRPLPGLRSISRRHPSPPRATPHRQKSEAA